MEMEMQDHIMTNVGDMNSIAMTEAEAMAIVETIRNKQATITTNQCLPNGLPNGFTSCQHDHVCPSCSSSLIIKVPTNSHTAFRSRRKLISQGEDALGLESARSANLLLQALSFDEATRNSCGIGEKKTQELELARLTEGVSYCPECKVHVVTSAEELEWLFEEYENGDASKLEYLRGSLLVAVDDAEVVALQSRKVLQPPSASPQYSDDLFSKPSTVISGTYYDTENTTYNNNNNNAYSFSQEQQSNKPKRPLDFEYDYRHKVATHAMATRIGRGYSLLEEICPECEMPLMKTTQKSSSSDRKECVVCPKLLKKIAKYQTQAAAQQQRNTTANSFCVNEGGKVMPPIMNTADQITAIIAEARSEAPQLPKSKTRQIVKPDVAEAKQYVNQRRIMGTTEVCKHKHLLETGGKDGCGGDDNKSHGTESMTDHSDDMITGGVVVDLANNPIDWEELLINGRSILSKRLNEGWTLSSTNCTGVNCKGTPLLTKEDGDHVNKLDYCVVCGGCGNGEDGAYEREVEWQAKAAELAEQAELDAIPDWEELAGNGRALLAERLKQGWTMSSDNCCGYHCNEMPLTNFEGGPNSCVVCGGSGSGCDGAYENYKPEEVVEEERALVSQELSQLLSMGWVLRESLCVQCVMPLVAEHPDAVDDLCILCGHLPQNNLREDVAPTDEYYGDDSYVNEYIDDANLNEYPADDYENGYENEYEYEEEYYEEEEVVEEESTVYKAAAKEAVIAPVVTYGDSNTEDAGRKLMAGWTLPDAGLCYHCQGIQMTPPNSHEIGCIQQGCPSALAAAYTFLPDPHESTGPVRLVGRGFSDKNRGEKEEGERDTGYANHQLEEENARQFLDQVEHEAFRYSEEYDEEYEEEEEEDEEYSVESPIHDDLPVEVGGHEHNYSKQYSNYDEPSIMSDDLSQVRSVASSALGVILVRLDDAKYELGEMMREGTADAHECAEKKVEIASLIERLSSAAVRMKRRE